MWQPKGWLPICSPQIGGGIYAPREKLSELGDIPIPLP